LETETSKAEQLKNDKMIVRIFDTSGNRGRSLEYWSKHYNIAENDIWVRMCEYSRRVGKMTWEERKKHYASLGIALKETTERRQKTEKLSIRDIKRLADIQTLYELNADITALKTLLPQHKQNTVSAINEEITALLVRLIRDMRRKAKELTLRLKNGKPSKWEKDHAEESKESARLARMIKRHRKHKSVSRSDVQAKNRT